MAVKRLIDLPEEYDVAPDWVFDRLREIDTSLEVVCASPGYWWVGSVKPLAQRVQAGHAALRFMKKQGFEKNDPSRWPQIRNAIMKSQGFGLIGKYRFNGGNEDWGGIIEDVRRADWLHRKYEDGTPELRAEIEGTALEDVRNRAAANIVQNMQADPRYLFKRILRGNPAPVPVGADIS